MRAGGRLAKRLTQFTRSPRRASRVAEAEEAGGTPPRAPPSVFAVRASAGHEKAVAEGINGRARVERADVRAVVVSPRYRGLVLVEAGDFDRLTNLVASVGHARGVVTPKHGGDAAVAPARVAELLAATSEDAEDAEDADADWESSLFDVPNDEMERDSEPEEEDAEDREEEAPEPMRAKKRSSPPSKSKGRARKGGELPAPTPEIRRILNLAMLVPVLVLGLGLLLAPRLFWDGLLYPYFWQSIEADASNAGGAAEAYNIVNTLTYAAILIPAIILIYRVLARLKIRVDTRFIMMLTPFLVLGGAARALEDSQYFSKPVSYAFISPLIYIAEGLFVLALVVASWWVARARARGGVGRGLAAWSAAFAPGAAALVWFHTSPAAGLAAPIPLPIVIAAVASSYLMGLLLVQKEAAPGIHGFVLNAGVTLLTLSAYLIARWILLSGWNGPATPAVTTHLGDVPAVVGLAGIATVATAGALFVAAGRFPKLAGMLTPLTVLLFFAQYLDASATYWGIDHWGYDEKHVVPGRLIEIAGTAAVMFPLKLVFVLLVSYLVDVLYRADMYDKRGEITTFGGLLKLVVIALGMGPGTRDMLRMAMGV